MIPRKCPECKNDSFTWSEEAESSYTKWTCHSCGYIAWEDDNCVSKCRNCFEWGLWFFTRRYKNIFLLL